MNISQNLEAWEALVVTAKTGNVSKTALLLDMDIPKVSRLITSLEKELGYELLDKSKRPFKPTKKCEIIVSLAEPILKSFRQMLDFSKGVASKCLIRIGSPIEIMQEFYSQKLLAYSRTHPMVSFEVVPEAGPDALMNDEADVLVVNKRLSDETNFVVRPFMQTSTPVLCSPEYLRRYGLPRTVDDLKKHTGLLLKTKTHLLTRFLYKGSQQSNLLQWKTLFLTHDQLAIKRLLLNHQGITTDLYFGHVLEEIKNGDLVPILPGWERAPWIMSLVTRRDRDLENCELRKFADWWAQSEADSALDRVVKGRRIIEQAQRNAAELFESLPYP